MTSLPPAEASEAKFTTQVNDVHVWTPPHRDHAHWVRVLVCRLLDSGAVHDEILRLLADVCQVKVKFSLYYRLQTKLREGNVLHVSVIQFIGG